MFQHLIELPFSPDGLFIWGCGLLLGAYGFVFCLGVLSVLQEDEVVDEWTPQIDYHLIFSLFGGSLGILVGLILGGSVMLLCEYLM